MMQRKNRPSSNANANNNNNNNNNNGYNGISNYENNSDNNNNNSNINNSTNINRMNDTNNKMKSSPSKPPPPSLSSSGGISIGALTGHNNHHHRTAIIPSGAALPTTAKRNTKPNNNATVSSKSTVVSVATIATVKRSRFGTRPFDEHWLNVDCCGLLCAGLTYALHSYGAYAFGWVLIPPWFSVTDEDGFRELTFACHFHRMLFLTIASLAVIAHFNAMTTDPGAVPPDANPLPDLDELDDLIKGESNRNRNRDQQRSSTGSAEVAQLHNTMGKSTANNNGNAGNDGNTTERANVVERGSSGAGAMAGGMARNIKSSSLMQEDTTVDYDNNNNNNNDTSAHNNNNNNTPTMPQAITMAGAVGAAVVGAPLVAGVAAVAGAAGVAGAVMSTAGASSSMSSSSGVQKRGNGQERRAPPGQQQRGRRMCRRCQAFKPPRAHHCSICKRCIVKMDHHCPWVNNCVGIGNHKYFLLFIFYTCLSCLYSFLFVIYRFVHCIGHVHSHHHGPRCVDHPTDLLPLVGLAVEALLFGLFTMCMMCDQWDVVTTNLTHIDRLKGETHGHHGRRSDPPVPGHNGGGYSQLPQHYNQGGAKNLLKNARAGINEVFGTGRHLLSSLSGTSSSSANAPTSSRFHYTWLSPLHRVCFPDTVRDDIFGYCRPVCGGGAARRLSLKSMEMVGRGGEKGRGAGAAEIV